MIEFQDSRAFYEEIEVKGHLVDSLILTRIFDTIMDLGGEFDVKEFSIGKKKTEYSYARLIVKSKSSQGLDRILTELYRLGAVQTKEVEATLQQAPSDRILPDKFYSTTNNPTSVYVNNKWIQIKPIMMDKAIVINNKKNKGITKSIRDIKKGDWIVVGEEGVKVKPPERPRENLGVFEFMSSKTSSEKPSTSFACRIAEDIFKAKQNEEKLIVVAGPAVVHTGAAEALATMIKQGYVQGLLSGNALAVHDIENALFSTSLGVNLRNGTMTLGCNRNHIAAINEVYKAGSLRAIIDKRILKTGIIYECITNKIPFILAGSIRDDGPLPEVITDTVKARQQYSILLQKADIVLMLATMLHSIAAGNLLNAMVRTICVDINPSVALKLLDRGTAQAASIVSDVGFFLPLLAHELRKLEENQKNEKKYRLLS